MLYAFYHNHIFYRFPLNICLRIAHAQTRQQARTRKPPPPRSTLLARIVIAGYFPRLAKTLKIQRLSQSRRPKGNDEQQRASQAGITSSGAGGRVRGGRRGGQRRQAWRVSSGSLRAPLLGRRRAPGALALRLRQETTRSFG